MVVFIQGNGYISYCFQECNMTCTCEKCNQKRVIDCLFVKVDVNLHIARQTQLLVKVNSLSFGTMAESCWESSSEEELFCTQSTFTAKSEEHDGKYLLSVVAIPLVLPSCMQSDLLIVVQEWVCRRVKGMENAQRIMLLLVKVYLISDGNCKLGIFFVLKILIVVFLVVSSQ